MSEKVSPIIKKSIQYSKVRNSHEFSLHMPKWLKKMNVFNKDPKKLLAGIGESAKVVAVIFDQRAAMGRGKPEEERTAEEKKLEQDLKSVLADLPNFQEVLKFADAKTLGHVQSLLSKIQLLNKEMVDIIKKNGSISTTIQPEYDAAFKEYIDAIQNISTRAKSFNMIQEAGSDEFLDPLKAPEMDEKTRNDLSLVAAIEHMGYPLKREGNKWIQQDAEKDEFAKNHLQTFLDGFLNTEEHGTDITPDGLFQFYLEVTKEGTRGYANYQKEAIKLSQKEREDKFNSNNKEWMALRDKILEEGKVLSSEREKALVQNSKEFGKIIAQNSVAGSLMHGFIELEDAKSENLSVEHDQINRVFNDLNNFHKYLNGEIKGKNYQTQHLTILKSEYDNYIARLGSLIAKGEQPDSEIRPDYLEELKRRRDDLVKAKKDMVGLAHLQGALIVETIKNSDDPIKRQDAIEVILNEYKDLDKYIDVEINDGVLKLAIRQENIDGSAFTDSQKQLIKTIVENINGITYRVEAKISEIKDELEARREARESGIEPPSASSIGMGDKPAKENPETINLENIAADGMIFEFTDEVRDNAQLIQEIMASDDTRGILSAIETNAMLETTRLLFQAETDNELYAQFKNKSAEPNFQGKDPVQIALDVFEQNKDNEDYQQGLVSYDSLELMQDKDKADKFQQEYEKSIILLGRALEHYKQLKQNYPAVEEEDLRKKALDHARASLDENNPNYVSPDASGKGVELAKHEKICGNLAKLMHITTAKDGLSHDGKITNPKIHKILQTCADKIAKDNNYGKIVQKNAQNTSQETSQEEGKEESPKGIKYGEKYPKFDNEKLIKQFKPFCAKTTGKIIDDLIKLVENTVIMPEKETETADETKPPVKENHEEHDKDHDGDSNSDEDKGDTEEEQEEADTHDETPPSEPILDGDYLSLLSVLINFEKDSYDNETYDKEDKELLTAYSEAFAYLGSDITDAKEQTFRKEVDLLLRQKISQDKDNKVEALKTLIDKYPEFKDKDIIKHLIKVFETNNLALQSLVSPIMQGNKASFGGDMSSETLELVKSLKGGEYELFALLEAKQIKDEMNTSSFENGVLESLQKAIDSGDAAKLKEIFKNLRAAMVGCSTPLARATGYPTTQDPEMTRDINIKDEAMDDLTHATDRMKKVVGEHGELRYEEYLALRGMPLPQKEQKDEGQELGGR